MKQRTMAWAGVALMIAASTIPTGCAPAQDPPGIESEKPAETTPEPSTRPEIETPDHVIIFAGQEGKYFIYPDYQKDKTQWEMKEGVLIRFINGTDTPVTVTAAPSVYFGTDDSTFKIDKSHSEIKKVIGLPADKADLKIELIVQSDTGPPLVVTGGPKMVVTESTQSAPLG